MGFVTKGAQEISTEKFIQEQKAQHERLQRERHELQRRIDIENQFKQAHNGGMEAPNYLEYPEGNTFPIPDGALGPFSTQGPGIQYIGGQGGNGLHSSVNRVRFMEETSKHPARVIYMKGNQAASPTTGKPIGRDNPENHLNPFTRNY